MSIPGIEARKEARGTSGKKGRTFFFFRLCSCSFLFFFFFSFFLLSFFFLAPHGTARLGYRENPINQVRAGVHEMDIFASERVSEASRGQGVTLLARVAARRRACEHAAERFMRREYFIPMAIETTPGWSVANGQRKNGDGRPIGGGTIYYDYAERIYERATDQGPEFCDHWLLGGRETPLFFSFLHVLHSPLPYASSPLVTCNFEFLFPDASLKYCAPVYLFDLIVIGF